MKNFTITILVLLLTVSAGVIFWQRQQLNVQELKDTSEAGSEVSEGEESESVQIEPEDGAEEGTVESYEELLVGVWQSVDDPQSVITFEMNGALRDVYAGGAISETGSYQVFDDPSNVPLEIVDVNGPFLRQSLGEEDYYYVIDEITDNSLVLIYLSRGNTLEYSRVNQ